jgi:hypothetical protein
VLVIGGSRVFAQRDGRGHDINDGAEYLDDPEPTAGDPGQ